MSTVAYLRVSTDQQDVDSQRFALRLLCVSRGWEYPERAEYVDAGISGAIADRPEYRRLLSDVAAAKVKRIICTDLDRVSRDPDERSRFNKHCARLGVEVVESGGVVNTAMPEGMLIERIKAAVAEFERSKIKQRCKNGIAAYIASGKHWGPKPKLSGADLERLVAEDRSQTYYKVAQKYGVDPATVRRAWKRADGGVASRPRGRRKLASTH